MTDDERREVARRLRSLRKTNPGVTSLGHSYLWSLLWAVCGEGLGESNRDHWFERMCSRLADLIEPTKPVDFDGFNHGIDSIYQWCFERLEGADGAEDELFCSIMSAIEDYRHPERATAHTVRAVDRDTLLELADRMETMAGMGALLTAGGLEMAAVSIREALGIADE